MKEVVVMLGLLPEGTSTYTLPYMSIGEPALPESRMPI